MRVNAEGILDCPSPINNGRKDCIASCQEVTCRVFERKMAVFIAWPSWTTSRGIMLDSSNVRRLQLNAHLNHDHLSMKI